MWAGHRRLKKVSGQRLLGGISSKGTQWNSNMARKKSACKCDVASMRIVYLRRLVVSSLLFKLVFLCGFFPARLHPPVPPGQDGVLFLVLDQVLEKNKVLDLVQDIFG